MDRTITRRITVVLPVDDDERQGRALAAGMTATDGARIGAVDNGLWRSMPKLLDALARAIGTPIAARLPFDHLSPHFDDQQRALAPFAAGVAGVVTGLGN